MKIAVIALGSNLGNSLENLRKAVARVGEIGEVVGVSGVYKTPPFFYEKQDDFLNATLALKTSLDAFELLKFFHIFFNNKLCFKFLTSFFNSIIMHSIPTLIIY